MIRRCQSFTNVAFAIVCGFQLMILHASEPQVEATKIDTIERFDLRPFGLGNLTKAFDEVNMKMNKKIDDFKNQAFGLFRRTYNKTYATINESATRSKLYWDKLNIINKWNEGFEKGRNSYKLSVNHYTDWTKKELSKIMGSRRNVDDSLANHSLHDANKSVTKRVTVPNSRDWAKSKCLAPVRDQAKCESCYAFAAIDLVATMHCLSTTNSKRNKSDKSNRTTNGTGVNTLRSVQQIIDCASGKREFSSYIRGCNGGQPAKVLDYLRRYAPRLVLEQDYPYKARRGRCKMASSSSIDNDRSIRFTKSGDYINFSKFPYKRLNSESEIMQHLANHGPVISSLRVVDNFVSYHSGLFADDSSGRCQRSSYNHIVLIVGYGRDTKTGRRYWLVKNSWGTDWGEGGFFRILRGNCRIANWALGIRSIE